MLLTRKAMLLTTPQQMASLIIGVAVFAGLLVLTFFTLRWLQRRGLPGLGGGNVKVLERSAVSHECAVLLVRVGPRLVALGQSKNGLTYLCELDPRDFAADNAENSGKDGFWGRFVRNLGTRWESREASRPDSQESRNEARPGSVPGEPSFGEIFAQIAARENRPNPIPGAVAPESGYTAVRTKQENRYGEQNYSRVRTEGGYDGMRGSEKGYGEQSGMERSGGDRSRKAQSYQEGIDRLMSLGEPDKLDSKMRQTAPVPRTVRRSTAGTGQVSGREKNVPGIPSAVPYEATPAEEAVNSRDEHAPIVENTGNAADNAVIGINTPTEIAQTPGEVQEEANIDDLLDRIAQRQSRYTKDKDA